MSENMNFFRPRLEVLESREMLDAYVGSGLWSQLTSWQASVAGGAYGPAQQLPGADDDVTVPAGGTLTVDQTATIRNLTVGPRPNTVLELSGQVSLTVTGQAGFLGCYINLGTGTMTCAGAVVLGSPRGQCLIAAPGEANPGRLIFGPASMVQCGNADVQVPTLIQGSFTIGGAGMSQIDTTFEATAQVTLVSGGLRGSWVANYGQVTLNTPNAGDIFDSVTINNFDRGALTITQGSLRVTPVIE
jgi:hypothetical protein